MSESSNSTMNINIFSELSTITTDNKISSTPVERVEKRVASDQLESQMKKIKVDRSSREEPVPSVAPKPFVQPKFVSAAEMATNARTNVQMMPEISDEELLEMAIQFELKHPEYSASMV